MIVLRKRQVRLHRFDVDASLEGVLTRRPWRRSGYFVLRQTGVVEAAGRTVPASSEALIPREKVDWVEVLG